MPDIVTGKTFVDGEKGITAAKLNQIQSLAVIQPAFYSTKPSSPTLDPTDVLLELKGTGAYAQITGSQIASSVAGQLPLADTTQNGMLRQVSGLTTDVVDGTNNCVPLSSFAGITQMRLRSFNAVGNSTFEVDARTAGTGAGVSGSFVLDRWAYYKTGTMTFSVVGQQDASASPILLPGTNFAISRAFVRYTLGTQQVSLGANDKALLTQAIEGPCLRELISDVSSVSLLVRSSVAGLAIGVTLQDAAATRTLALLATISAANTWTLLSFPNLPVWAAGTTWSVKPGNIGYYLTISLAAGSSLIVPANNTWQNGNYQGAVGQSNFAASPVGSTVDIAVVQHEPGSVCTTPIDCPFTQNYDDCLRYFQKTYDYTAAPGATGQYGRIVTQVSPQYLTYWIGNAPFKKTLAKPPVVINIYNDVTGTLNSVQNITGAGTNLAIGSAGAGTNGINQFQITGTPVPIAGDLLTFQYTVDTGW